jgi:hypothetical protein
MESETQAKVWAAATGRDAHVPVIETGEGGLRLSCCEDGEHVPDLLSWAGMGALLDVMGAKGWGYVLMDGAEAYFRQRGDLAGESEAQGLAPKLPLAVARAAAAALGVEEGRA